MAIIVDNKVDNIVDNIVGGNILFSNIVVRKYSWQISWHVWQCSCNILYGNIVGGNIVGTFGKMVSNMVTKLPCTL